MKEPKPREIVTCPGSHSRSLGGFLGFKGLGTGSQQAGWHYELHACSGQGAGCCHPNDFSGCDTTHGPALGFGARVAESLGLGAEFQLGSLGEAVSALVE